MKATILVATPHAAFGELLRISLVDSGQYQVHLVQTAKEARAVSRQNTIHLVILDAALSDEPFIPLCMNMLEQHPGVRLVVIPPDNNPNHPALGGLMPHGYLSRPFYLPDLIDTVSRLLADQERQFQAQALVANPASVPAAYPTDSVPPWLQEPLTLRDCLEKELSGTQAIAAIAAMFTSDNTGNGTIRASVGNLNDKAAQDLIEIVFRCWNRAEKIDLMRFVRLNEEKKEVLVYATQIISDLILILAYNATAPLSQIRPQTKAMAQSLANIPPEKYQVAAPAVEEQAQSESSFSQPAPDETSFDLPAQEPAEGWLIGLTSPEPSEDSGRVLAQTEIETQPLDDNMFYNRMYSSFSSLDDSVASEQPSKEIAIESEQQAGTPEIAESPAAPETSEPSTDLTQSDEGESKDTEVINLSALLGSVPPPDPINIERRKPLLGSDWIPDRSAMNPIPTLSGGLNGGPSLNNSVVSMWDHADEDERDQPAGNYPDNPAPSEGTDWLGDPPPKKKAARTAPLEPQTMPRDSLPAEPSLPIDYAPPINDPPIDIEEEDFLQAVSGRSAGMEVKTEPPVTPPGVPAAIEPRPLESLTEPPVDLVEDTHPHLVSTITSLTQLEPASPALSLLNYTCVLVPRLPQHYLTGELADRMAVWVQQLCLAFGWRLEGISIRPEYLQWTVQVAPAISPGNLVRIVRQRTSLHTFGNYPHLAEQNPSGDFWANGYLIVSGTQPPSAQLLRDYIAQTRKRQGVNKP